MNEEREAAEHLRLRPAVHRHVVPAGQQLARSKRAVGLDPVAQDAADDGVERRLELRKAIPEQQAQIDALGAVVELALVDRQPRRLRERLRQPV